MNIADYTLPMIDAVQPVDIAAVAVAVRDACAKGLAVYPLGGGTTLNGAQRQRSGVDLSLAKLNRLVDYPADDLTITVEAGMTIAELSRHLKGKRQRLPVDVRLPEQATVGGAVATNAAGPRRYAYGSMRDYVLGLTAVDGRGNVFSGGGRVVKNAAGYNMCRLMAGSHGTLAIITQVTLMVRPMVESSALMVCEVPDFSHAERLLAGIIELPARPVAVELAAGRQRDSDLALGPLMADHVARLYVGFEGAIEEVDAAVEQLRSQWAKLEASAPTLVPAGRAEPMWRRLADFTADAEINVLPGAVADTVEKIVALDADAAIQSHAGDGVIRVKCGRLDGAAIAALRDLATKAAGNMVVLRQPEGATLCAADVWGTPGPEIRVMRAIKGRFDPENILNPGRFVF